MFESITIKSREQGGYSVEPGFLTECLLFYKKVNLLANRHTFAELFTLFGIREVLELLRMERLNLLIKKDNVGPAMFPMPKEELYDVQNWFEKHFDVEEYILNELSGKVEESLLKSHLPELVQRISVQTYQTDIAKQIKQDLEDSTYLSQAIFTNIKFRYPDTPLSGNDVIAHYYQVSQFGPFPAHRLETNIDWAAYPLISPGGILLSVAEARGDIDLAGQLDSAIADKPLYSLLVQYKVNNLIEKLRHEQQQLSLFQEMVLPNYKPIAAVIASKEKDFGEFINLLDKADKFREWLQQVDHDQTILAAYYQAITEKTWVDKLPTKSIRFAIITAAALGLDKLMPGGIGTVAGVVLTAGDAFLLDKLVQKWRPNQFIDDELKGFIE